MPLTFFALAFCRPAMTVIRQRGGEENFKAGKFAART
jgi:hypothetical protein